MAGLAGDYAMRHVCGAVKEGLCRGSGAGIAYEAFPTVRHTVVPGDKAGAVDIYIVRGRTHGFAVGLAGLVMAAKAEIGKVLVGRSIPKSIIERLGQEGTLRYNMAGRIGAAAIIRSITGTIIRMGPVCPVKGPGMATEPQKEGNY